MAAYCLWILSLPVFPSQDGPLHLYYANVFGHLLSRSPGVYARFYRIGSLFPPYSLYYYLLLGLGKAMSLPAADKLVICTSVVLNAFGFRYLARRSGPGGEVAAFLVLPVLLNWPLLMGFVNFSLSLGLVLWAVGLWSRFADDHSLARRLGFVLLLYVIMLTHPVPLLLLIGLCFVDLLVRALGTVRRSGTAKVFPWHLLLLDTLCLLAAVPAFLYVRKFAIANVLQQSANDSLHRRISDNLFNYLHGAGLLLFQPGGVFSTVYRVGFGLVFLLALGTGLAHGWRAWRTHHWDVAAAWFVLAVLCLVAFPLVPRDLNGAHYFAWRLAVPVYLVTALGATGGERNRGWKGFLLIGASIALSVYTLGLAAVRCGPAARMIAASADAPAHAPGSLGVLLQAGPDPFRAVFTFRPFLWGGAHYFRQTGSVLYNSSWLDETIIPVKRNDNFQLLEPTSAEGPARVATTAPFAIGGQWNPPQASFFFAERISPEAGTQIHTNLDWPHTLADLGALDRGGCNPAGWYCIANR
ncbi:MAG: hypothetical protein ACRYFU_22940 [Janthinobacterium lividum]